jgi:hypothetical protein
MPSPGPTMMSATMTAIHPSFHVGPVIVLGGGCTFNHESAETKHDH